MRTSHRCWRTLTETRSALFAIFFILTFSQSGWAGPVGNAVEDFATGVAASTATSIGASCLKDFKSLGQKVRGLFHAGSAPKALTPEDQAAREDALHQGLVDWKSQYSAKWKWQIDDLPAKMRQKLNAQLDHDGRTFLELTPQERHDLVEMITLETAQESERAHIAHEASERVQAANAILAGESGDRASALHSGKLRQVVLDALHESLEKLNRNFSDLPAAEKAALMRSALIEANTRFDAVDRVVKDRLQQAGHSLGLSEKALRGLVLDTIHHELMKDKLRFQDIADSPQGALLVDAALQEVLSRIPDVERALDKGIARTGRPWKWWLQWKRNGLKEKIVGWLGDELAKADHQYRDLTTSERQALVDSITGGALSPIQSRPTFLVAGLGYGIPIALGYVGSIFLPDVVKPAWYVITGGITSPFSSGVNYWLNGKLKPIFTVKVQDHAANADKSPFIQEMERIGQASVSFSDPFKDGRNITKDSEIPLRDALNDAAWLIANETDAQRTVAGAVLYQATAFPEVTLNSFASFTLYMKLKDRFGTPEAYGKIQQYIRELATRNGVSPTGPLKALDKILQPDLWRQIPPAQQTYSAQADAELQQMLDAARQEQNPKETSKGVAWAALFYSLHFPKMRLSNATTFRFYSQTRDRLANAAAYNEAKAIIEKEAPGLHVDPQDAIRRLDGILRTDLWKSSQPQQAAAPAVIPAVSGNPAQGT